MSGRSLAALLSAAVVAASGSALLSAAYYTPAQEHEHQHEAGAHRHPAAEKIKNPVAPDAASIAAGKSVYEKHCTECHGDSGKGDGSMADEYTPKPADLTDAEWKHGSSDGEIFVVIRDGVKNTGMKAFGKKLTTRQIWDVVNYLRSIGPAKSH
jgi:mono/diheme cytochrome c family protein